MIDYIRNGVTTGGFAPNIAPEPQGANIYNQYMEQLFKERNDAMNKNFELVKGIDLSKVSPVDRDAVQAMYNQWKNTAMRPPNTTNRQDIMAWRQKVMQGETDLTNRIGEVISGRKNLVDNYNEVKEHLSPNGLALWNGRLNSPITNDDGSIKSYDPNDGERSPEHVFDVHGRFGEILKGSQTPDKTQIGFNKRKDGKIVHYKSKITNVDQYLNNALDEYHSNPQLAYVLDRQYQDYKTKNPGSDISADDFVKQAAAHNLPQQMNWDKARLKGINTTPGMLYTDVDEEVPNDYKVTINNGRSFADKKAEVFANYQALMGNTQNALKSGDPNALSNAAQQWSPYLIGKSLDGDGKINRAQLVKTPDGRTVLRATGTNQLTGLPKNDDYDLNDPATWQKLHGSFNNQFRNQNFGLQVPADNLNTYTSGLSEPEQINVPTSDNQSVQQYATPGSVSEQGGSVVAPNATYTEPSLMGLGQPQPKPQTKLSKLKQKISNGLLNFGN